jgi:hypothetical protein
MHKGKIFAFVGMAVLGGALYFTLQAQAQTSTGIKDSEAVCPPAKASSSNGYSESYTNPNTCHSARVLFPGVGSTLINSDNLIMRCPANSTTNVHTRAHYPQSPTLNGQYDGGAGGGSHYYCVDANGYQVEAVLVDMTPPTISTPSATNTTQTSTTITWTTNENSDSQVEYDTTTNNFRFSTTIDSTMTLTHSVNLTGLTAGTTYNFYAKSKDAAGNLTYYTSSFTTLAVPTCTLSLSFANGKTSYVKGENVSYTWSCSPSGTRAANATVQVVQPNGTASTYNSATDRDTATLGFETSSLAVGTYTLRVCIDPNCAPTSSMSSLQFTVTEPATTAAIPAAPTIATAVYSTENLGQREVVLTVTANAANATYNQLYWHLSGTAWPATAPKDTYSISSSTWSQPVNVGRIQIFAPTVGGTYEYKLQACNASGCSSSNVISVTVPGTTATGTTTTTTTNQSNWVNHTWTFSDRSTQTSYILNRTDSEYVNYIASIDTQCRTTARPATLTWMTGAGDDSSTNWRNFGIPVCSGSGIVTTVPPPTSTSCSLNLSFTNGKTSYARGEFVNYTYACSPAGTRALNATIQVVKPDGTATTYNSATNIDTSSMGFDTVNLTAGTYTLRVCVDPNCTSTTSSMSSLQFTVAESATSPRSCTNGEKCPSGSWCNNGAQCFYPDSQITCVAWNNSNTGVAPASSVSCSAGTTACNPSDSNCVEPGQTVPYSSGKWCASGNQQYYSKDGTKMTCAGMNASAPSGYTSCRPDDSNCVPEESYGPSSGWCSRGMKCNQKVTDNNPNNDVYCSKMPMPPNPEPQSCPAGYGSCSPGDTNCKEKGDSWTGTDSSYYCTNAQKCTTATGGLCVGWNESCPTGTKYCSSTDQNCVEPGETKPMTGTNGGGYWCGGGGMTFYSSTKVFCEPMKRGGAVATMMFSAADIKAILAKLGTGWGLCRPNDNNCTEPGKTGSASGWCAWMPMGYAMSSPTNSGSVRSCPPLDDNAVAPVLPTEVATTTPVIVTPIDLTLPRECGPSEIPSPNNACVTPLYKWNVSTKSFEKCSQPQTMGYGAPTGASAQTMVCEPMNLEIEKEWKTEKYVVHPPETDGQWYMPPWDAASPMLQYDPNKDQLIACGLEGPAAVAAYVPPCVPVPEIDKGWMLKKFRAEYRMYKLYSAQNGGVLPATAVATETQIAQPIVPKITGSNQCKLYLFQLRQNLVTDKKFWKDVNRQFKSVPKEYPDSADVSALINDSKPLLVEIEKLVRSNKCDEDTLGTIQDKLDVLHNDSFSQMSIYLPDMQDYAQYGQCKIGLTGYVKRLQSLLKISTDAESKVAIQELIDSINAKTVELDSHLNDFEYDPAFECDEFSNEVSSQISPLIRVSDKEVNRIIEDVVQKKFQPVIDQLTTQLEERGKKVDELLVQIAELHKSIAAMSQSAPMISDRIAMSYNSMSFVDNKYAKQKTDMEVAKEKILPLVSDAVSIIKGSKCVNDTDKERLIQTFGTLASVNWVGGSADELEKRVSLFTSSCKGKDVSKSDVDTFIKSVETASVQNLSSSYQQGLTPFADVPTHEWYFGPMLTASNEGFMTQGRPSENVLKQDALLMILRATDVKEKDISGDCKLDVRAVMAVSPYAVCAVNYAAAHGIALGGSMTTPISRIEMVSWLKALTNLPAGENTSVLSPYTDLSGLTASQKTALASVVTSGIMVGNVGDGAAVFNPRNELGRAELAAILGRLLNSKKTVSQ